MATAAVLGLQGSINGTAETYLDSSHVVALGKHFAACPYDPIIQLLFELQMVVVLVALTQLHQWSENELFAMST